MYSTDSECSARWWNYSTVWYRELRENVIGKEIRGSWCISTSGQDSLEDSRPDLSSQIVTTSRALLAIDNRSRMQLFADVRVAHGFRMEIELVLRCVCGEIGMAGSDDGADLSDAGRERDSKEQD